ncbi:MAG: GatB/YqeY domain-containing protein [Patescibacteria group bacterium]
MLKEQLQQELNQALKSGEPGKRLLLGMVLTAVKNRELSKRSQLSKTITDSTELEKQSRLNDDEVLAVIAGEVKKRKESIEQFSAGHRPELAEKEKAEMELLLKYLPTQLSDDAVRAEVGKVISETGAENIKALGKVMSQVMARLKGRADGNTVSRIVKEQLGQ